MSLGLSVIRSARRNRPTSIANDHASTSNVTAATIVEAGGATAGASVTLNPTNSLTATVLPRSVGWNVRAIQGSTHPAATKA